MKNQDQIGPGIFIGEPGGITPNSKLSSDNTSHNSQGIQYVTRFNHDKNDEQRSKDKFGILQYIGASLNQSFYL